MANSENTNFKFEDWHREQMRDPGFRVWRYVNWPRYQYVRLRIKFGWWLMRLGARISGFEFDKAVELLRMVSHPLPDSHYRAIGKEPPCGKCTMWDFWNEADSAYDDL